MSYDQYVLPAEHCTSTEAAQRHLSAQSGAAPSAAASEVAGRIGERIGEHLSISPLTAEGDTVAVAARIQAVAEARQVVHEEALAAGLGVYDPQLRVVVDPREVLPGSVVLRRGDFPTLTPGAVTDLVAGLRVDDYLIVQSRDPETYAQTYRRAPDRFDVERREGDADHHFATVAADAAQVQALFDAWMRDDRTVLDAVAWTQLRL